MISPHMCGLASAHPTSPCAFGSLASTNNHMSQLHNVVCPPVWPAQKTACKNSTDLRARRFGQHKQQLHVNTPQCTPSGFASTYNRMSTTHIIMHPAVWPAKLIARPLHLYAHMSGALPVH